MTIESIFPQWVLNVLAVGVGIGLGGLGLWVGCAALEKLVRLIRRTLAADLRLQRMKRANDRAALDYWVRDSFKYKHQAEREKHRADQERYDRQQIALGADNYMRMKEGRYA